MPLDLPLIKRGDVERILENAREGKEAVLVPSLQGTGTNAIYRSPPTLFPSQFGPGSLALHEKSVRYRCKNWTILPLAGMALDIDEPEDLGELIARGVECPTLDFLKSRGIVERLGNLRRNVI